MLVPYHFYSKSDLPSFVIACTHVVDCTHACVLGNAACVLFSSARHSSLYTLLCYTLMLTLMLYTIQALLATAEWPPIAAAAQANNHTPLLHKLASISKQTEDLTRQPCECRARQLATLPSLVPTTAAAIAAAQPLQAAAFVAMVQREGERLLVLDIVPARTEGSHQELHELLVAAVQCTSAAAQLQWAQRAVNWLSAKCEQVQADALNDQLQAVTSYLWAEGAKHERGLARARIAAATALAARTTASSTAAAAPLQATTAFVRRALTAVAVKAADSTAAQELLIALQQPVAPVGAVAALVVQGVLTEALNVNASSSGPYEAPETLALDGARLHRSAAAVDTAAAAAAISAAIAQTVGRSGAAVLDDVAVTSLLTLLEADDLSTEHIVAQAVQYAVKAASAPALSTAACSSLAGIVRAIVERQSPLRDLYLRRCLQCVAELASTVHSSSGVIDNEATAKRKGLVHLGEYLAQRAVAPLLAVARYSEAVYGSCYATMVAEALTEQQQQQQQQQWL
jgi:T-complex protein 11